MMKRILFLALLSMTAHADSFSDLAAGKAGKWWYRCLVARSSDGKSLTIEQSDIVSQTVTAPNGREIPGIAHLYSANYSRDASGATIRKDNYKLMAIAKVQPYAGLIFRLVSILPNGDLGYPIESLAVSNANPSPIETWAITLHSDAEGDRPYILNEVASCAKIPAALEVSMEQSKTFDKVHLQFATLIQQELVRDFNSKICTKWISENVYNAIQTLHLSETFCGKPKTYRDDPY